MRCTNRKLEKNVCLRYTYVISRLGTEYLNTESDALFGKIVENLGHGLSLLPYLWLKCNNM